MTQSALSPTALRFGEALTIDVPGLRLAAKAWGNPEGVPFLGLHGWLDNANTFNRLAPLLPELNFIALDFAGPWALGPPGARGVHYTAFFDVQDVVAAAGSLGFERFGLIGHSMEGAVTSETAGLFPERVTQAISIDGFVHHQGSPKDCNDRNKEAILQMLKASEKKPPVYASIDAMAERVTQATDQASLRPPSSSPGATTLWRAVTWRTDPRIRFATPLRITERQLDELMAQSTAPALLIAATQGDRWFRGGLERRRAPSEPDGAGDARASPSAPRAHARGCGGQGHPRVPRRARRPDPLRGPKAP